MTEATDDETPRRGLSFLSRAGHVGLVFSGCSALLALHLVMRAAGGEWKNGLDRIALGLTLAALSPWLAKIVASAKLGGFEIAFRTIDREVKDQRSDLETVKFLIGHFLGRDELSHLEKLAARKPFIIDINHFRDEFQQEMRHLRAIGLIDNFDGTGFQDMYKARPETTRRDVHSHFYITESGRKMLSLRLALEAKQEQPPTSSGAAQPSRAKPGDTSRTDQSAGR